MLASMSNSSKNFFDSERNSTRVGPENWKTELSLTVGLLPGRRLPSSPEFARGPALLFAVILPANLSVAFEFFGHVIAISFQALVIASLQQIADCIRRKYS